MPSTSFVKGFERHIWWLLYFGIPLVSTWQFHNITNFFVNQQKFEALNEKNQIKIRTKVSHAVYFFFTFVPCTIATVMMFIDLGYDFGPDAKLPYITDKIFKYGLSMVAAVYVTDIIYYRKYMKWFIWSHHIVSLFVFTAVYDYDISFIPDRLYLSIFGCLLSSTWPLYCASIYYYLGDKTRINLRAFLYLISLVIHFIFVMGQLSIGIIFRIYGYEQNIGRLIFFIIFEITVLPAQAHTISDIYKIIKYKICNKTKSCEETKINIEIQVEEQIEMMSPTSCTSGEY
eukprot:544098_1